MEPESSLLFRGDTSVKDPTPPTESHSRERVLRSDVEADLVGLGQKNVGINEILDQIKEKATSILEFSFHWEEIDKELKERTMEVDLKNKSVMERLRQVEEKEKKIRLLEREIKAKEKENEEAMKELEDKEAEIDLLSKLHNEKTCEFDKKMKQFVKQTVAVERRIKDAEVVETSLKSREKELQEKEKIFKAKAEEIAEKMKELGEGSVQGQTSKRSADNSLIRCSKRSKQNDEDKETEPNVEEEEEVSSEPGIDSEFNDFSKTIDSFKVGQLWALYDHVDEMPRLYGRIKRVIKSRSCIQVIWVNPKDEEEDTVPIEETVPIACGRFDFGIAETKDLSTFSHEMHRNIRGGSLVLVYPRKGETWAVFRDWRKTWTNNPRLHKPPYKYDFMEILLDFDDRLGVGGIYLDKVDGFVSVFKHAGQQELRVPPDEMNRFSHRVPSYKLSGEEKMGVPVGSFELDPYALPSSMLKCGHSNRQEPNKDTERQSE